MQLYALAKLEEFLGPQLYALITFGDIGSCKCIPRDKLVRADTFPNYLLNALVKMYAHCIWSNLGCANVCLIKFEAIVANERFNYVVEDICESDVKWDPIGIQLDFNWNPIGVQ